MNNLSDPNKDIKELIFRISKDELLTKTQIRYLESRLVQIGIQEKTATSSNHYVSSASPLICMKKKWSP